MFYYKNGINLKKKWYFCFHRMNSVVQSAERSAEVTVWPSNVIQPPLKIPLSQLTGRASSYVQFVFTKLCQQDIIKQYLLDKILLQ